MISTPVDVCNLALARVGSGYKISSLDEGLPESTACERVYDLVRRRLLSTGEWPFAVRRVALAVPESHSAELDEAWEYVYAIPSDMLRPLDVWSGTRVPTAESEVAYSIEYDADLDQLVLCCDEEDAQLRYVFDQEDVYRMTAPFVDALAWGVAVELALDLVGKPELAAQAAKGYEAAIRQAKEAIGQWNQKDPAALSMFETARW